MCGRYVSTKSTGDLLDEFDAVDATDAEQVEPDFNIAPTKPVRAVLTRTLRGEQRPVRQLRVARWGLVPSWAKDTSTGSRMFNARAENVADKPAFRRAFEKRRCLLPADGWYEWLREVDPAGKPRKQPFYMTPPDGHSLALAGLYEFWRAPDAEEGTPLLLSVTVITVQSFGQLAEIHDRMPLVLDRRSWQRWLDPSATGPTGLLEPRDEVSAETLELRPVSQLVNSVDNNSPELLDPVDRPPVALELF